MKIIGISLLKSRVISLDILVFKIIGNGWKEEGRNKKQLESIQKFRKI